MRRHLADFPPDLAHLANTCHAVRMVLVPRLNTHGGSLWWVERIDAPDKITVVGAVERLTPTTYGAFHLSATNEHGYEEVPFAQATTFQDAIGFFDSDG